MHPVWEDRQVNVVMGMESKRPSGIKMKHPQMKALYVQLNVFTTAEEYH